MQSSQPHKPFGSLWLSALLALLALAVLSAAGLAAGGISLTKSDHLIDSNGNGKADPGETIEYTFVLKNSNSGGIDNVQFSDTLDANTSLVPGSVNISPLAAADAYETVGNTLLEVGVTAGSAPAVRVSGSLTANDREFNGDTFAIQAYDSSSAHSGTVNLNADGTFTYLPAAGFSGTDTFTYTLSDASGLTSVATVTITVTGQVWYVDDNAAAGGSGRSTSPFTTLGAAQTASAAGDTIYLFSGAYTSGLTLKDNQTLTGEGLALTLGGHTLRAAGTRPQISAAANSLVLGNANTIQGLNLANSAGSAVSASAKGGQTALSQVNITLSGSGSGINLSNQTGTFTYSSGSIQGATGGRGIELSGGTADVNFQTVPLSLTGGGVSIASKSGGTVTWDGASPLSITSNGVQAIVLTSNSGASFNFNGGLTLASSASPALQATGGGTLSISGASNTITTANAAAVTIQNTSIGPNGIRLLSVSANGAANNAILLSATGSQGVFQVTGNGTTNGSGGTIQNNFGSAISLTNAQRVFLSNLTLNNANLSGSGACTFESNTTCNAAIKLSAVSDVRLENVDISGSAQTAINGENVAGFSYRNSVLNVSTDALDEDGIDLRQLSGTVEISGNTLSNAYDRGLLVRNSGGTLVMSVTNNTFNTVTLNDAAAFDFANGGTAAAEITFSGNTVQNINGAGFRLNNEGSGAVQARVQNNTISSSGSGVDLSAAGSGRTNYLIANNAQIRATWVGVNIENLGPSALMDGRVENNPDIRASDAASSAIWVHAENSGKIVTRLSGNTLNNYGYRGIEIESVGGSANVAATVIGNILTQPAGATQFAGLYLRSGNNQAGDASQLCANLTGNTIHLFEANPDAHDVQLSWLNQGATRFYLQGLSDYSVSDPYNNPVGEYLLPANTFVEYYVSPGTYAASVCETTSYSALDGNGTALARAGLPQNSALQPDSLSPAVEASAPVPAHIADQTAQRAAAGETASAPGKSGLASLLPAWLLKPFGAGETVSQELGTLPGGATLTLRFQVTVNAAIAGGSKAIANQAQVTGDGIPATLSDDPDTVTADDPTRTLHGAAPDLAVTLGGSPDPALPGENLVYTVAYYNNGTQPALAVQLHETLPAGTNFNAAASSVGWSCVSSSCTLHLGSLANGGSGAVTFAVLVNSQFASGVAGISNQVSIDDDGSGGADLNPPDNSASLDSALSAQPELSLTKSDGGATFLPGGSIDYTLSYANSGSQAAVNLTLSETVPANTSFNAGLSSAGWSCLPNASAGSTCTLDLAALAAGASGSAHFVVDIPLSLPEGLDEISNSAAIADDGSNGTEANSANNSAADTTPLANLVPELSALTLTSPLDENGIATLSGSLSDGNSDPLSLEVAWGDGQSDTYNYPAGTTSFSETHRYRDDNPSGTASDTLSAALTLSDGQGGEDTAGLNLTVNNLDPLLGSLIAAGTTAGRPTTLSANIGDTGTLDSFSLKIDWGDGASETFTYPAGTTRFSEQHTYAETAAESNLYSIQAELSDDDGGVDTGALDVTINKPAQVVTVSDEDFETAVPLEWQSCSADLSVTPRGARGFLGEFGNETACLSLENLPAHTMVLLKFDLYILRSWDGNVTMLPDTLLAQSLARGVLTNGETIGPDRWKLQADETTLIDTTFSNWWGYSWGLQAYPGSFATGSYLPRSGALEYGSLGYGFGGITDQDSVYRISRSFNHSGETLRLDFSASGLQALADESWGLDNVEVIILNTTNWSQTFIPLVMR